MADTARVLCVDGDRNVLAAMVERLSRDFVVFAAECGATALRILGEGAPFAAVVTDDRLTDMDGVTLLTRVEEVTTNVVPVLLTEGSNLRSAIDALNGGHVYRLLLKPCPADAVRQAVEDAVRQHRLLTGEPDPRRTLMRTVATLLGVIGEIEPEIAGRAIRVSRRVGPVAVELNLRDWSEVEIAALLSQIGSIGLPGATISKLYGGAALTEAERELVGQIGTTGARLLTGIPGFERIQVIVEQQQTPFARRARGVLAMPREGLPIGARILKVLLDCDVLETRGHAPIRSIEQLRARPGEYDPDVLDALERVSRAERHGAVKYVSMDALRVGMTVCADLVDQAGNLVCFRGQSVSPTLVSRLEHVASESLLDELLAEMTEEAQPPA